MRKPYAVLACPVLVLVSMLLTGTAAGGEAPGNIAAPVPQGPPSSELFDALMENEFRFNDFEQMIYVLGFAKRTPAVFDANNPPQMSDQEKAFRANLAEWLKQRETHYATDAYKKTQEGREKIRAEKDEAKKAELEKEYQSATKESRTKMERLRSIIMGPMTAEQRMYWAQYCCYRALLQRFTRATEKLTDGQKAKLWELAGKAAKELAAADYVATDPYLSGEKWRAAFPPALSKAYKSVLTDAQRKDIPDPDAPKK